MNVVGGDGEGKMGAVQAPCDGEQGRRTVMPRGRGDEDGDEED